MLLLAQLDPIITLVCVLAVLAIGIGLLLKRIKQPYIIGYILVGALLGEHGMGFIENAGSIQRLGELGVILLLFFIGMEISLPDLIKRWRIAAIGTLMQVGISVGLIYLIGWFFGWELARSVTLGFVIALSSSAVIIKLIEDRGLIDTRIGKNVLSILLTQDIIIVPMLIVTTLLGGESVSAGTIISMTIGGLLIIGVLVYIFIKKTITLPLSDRIENDHELQVFLAIFFCFGGALVSGLFGLSAALGAFVGGMVMHASKATDWIYDTLHSFRVLFVAFFFISIGLQLDFNFIYEHSLAIGLVVLVVYITNHLLNSIILRLFSCSWKEAILGGAMLAQIGELSFLLSSSALSLQIIDSFGYKFTISLISLTLVISPFWISLTEAFLRSREKAGKLIVEV